MTSSLEKKIAGRKILGNLRQLQIPEPLTDFSSNDYLGLARSSKLADLVRCECELQLQSLNGLGSTGSRLLTGNSSYAMELEDKIARFHGFDAGLIVGCGYMANVGLLSIVADENDTIFFDVSIHASMRDGIRLSRSKALPFRHNDVEHLKKRLEESSVSGQRFICLESIYSTDGSKAPLDEIYHVAKAFDARLIVDEAHAVGIYGENGRGLVSKEYKTSHIFAQVVTFGKALGVYGAIILGNFSLKEALINFATPCIYTTALPFQMLAAIKCSYELFPSMEKERKHVHRLIKIFQKSYPLAPKSHIQALPFKGNGRAKKAADLIQKAGFDVRPLLSPTVRRGYEVLRLCLHAYNTDNELARVLKVLKCYEGTDNA